MTNSNKNTDETIQRMKDNDAACRLVFRFQQNPNAIYDMTNHTANRVRELANCVIREGRLPRTVGEWIAVTLHHEQRRQVEKMRRRAREDAQIAYIKAERWLKIIDNTTG